MARKRPYFHFIILVILALATYSCSDKKPEKKGEVIDEEKFIDILVDVHIADAVLSVDFDKENPDMFVPENFYNQVLKNHGITRHDFDRSIEYYAEEPARLELLYQKVSEKLSVMEGSVKGVKIQNETGELVDNPDSIPVP